MTDAEPSPASYPVALSMSVPRGSVHPVILGGDELAVWRDEGGAAHIWEDRCPHRGMRLSFGFVRGARLMCLYHGWEFRADGTCARIPAHPDMAPPSTICTESRPSSEAWGMIFAGASRTSQGPQTWFGVRSIYVDQTHGVIADMLGRPGCLGTEGFAADGPVHLGAQGQTHLALGVQPISPGCTALHLASTAPDPLVRLNQCRALVALRHRLEERP